VSAPVAALMVLYRYFRYCSIKQQSIVKELDSQGPGYELPGPGPEEV